MMGASPPPSYDDDFFAWTQDQASALRQLPRTAAGNRVDIIHLAEEIEDLGKRDLREVKSYLVRLFEHLIKIGFLGDGASQPHWRSEARHFQASAAEAFSPSMRQLIEVDRLWERGRKEALAFFQDLGQPLAIREWCPFSLDDMISEDFDVEAELAILKNA